MTANLPEILWARRVGSGGQPFEDGYRVALVSEGGTMRGVIAFYPVRGDQKMQDDLVRLIERSDPAALTALQNAHPNAADMLSRLGTRRAAVAPTPEDLTAARLDLLLKGLGPLRRELQEIKSFVTQTMKKVQRIKFIGAVVATLAGLVMAITAALGIHELWEKVVSAAFATFGGLAVILSDHVQSAPSGQRLASVEEYGKLSQMASELYKLEARAERHDAYPLTNEELEEMTEEMENYAAHINALQVK